jgi:hypothetical protein
MNDNDFYPYAYCEIGQRYYESHSGHYKKRISMVGGLCREAFLAPFMFNGHCNTQVFEVYIEKILIPTLTPGKIIVVDNASFHQSQKIKDFIAKADCQFIYLPPYSPDLNPIEHYWHKIKNAIRKQMRNVEITLENAMENTLKTMSIN